MDSALFYVLAATVLVSGLLVIVLRRPIGSALALIVTLTALSGIFGLLAAPFVAILQIVIYAGAIMVLFLFVIMLLGVRREETEGRGARRLAALGVVLGLAFVFQVAFVLGRLDLTARAQAADASVAAMARRLFSPEYLYAFEATSILILAALVGAILLAQQRPGDGPRAPGPVQGGAR
jgi:NADH-quinone oxidoreductase subunit J